jgi:hypothetical protein
MCAAPLRSVLQEFVGRCPYSRCLGSSLLHKPLDYVNSEDFTIQESNTNGWRPWHDEACSGASLYRCSLRDLCQAAPQSATTLMLTQRLSGASI